MKHNWRWLNEGRMMQVKFENGEDIANLAELDRKHWLAISMPVKGVRFDSRMLELMDTDHDGRIRVDEVLAAVEFLKSRDVDLDSLFKPSADDERALDDVLARQADLSLVKPSESELKAMAAWEAEGKSAAVAVVGKGTADASAALAAVESVIDEFFEPPADMPLVSDEPEKTLPLTERINPRYSEAIRALTEKCIKPIIGDVAVLDRTEWSKVKAAFAPYRAWVGSKPVMNAAVMGQLEDEERVLRYRLHLLEFLENYVNMHRLYAADSMAIFQTGVLRIDAKELSLCFHVDNEAAHSALAERSNCCVIYLKLSRPSEGASASLCAVVTAGSVGQLYVGRNGVFYDRDGRDWEAVVTKVVENQVSLAEAFWSPWRKIGEGIAEGVKKFLGERAVAANKKVEAGVQNAQAGGAALASSVAAIGIGVGMLGAAAASLITAIKGLRPWWMFFVALAAVVLVVSIPSVAISWFKLRRRDLSAILNACGWAINRPMRFSMRRARGFTKCARSPRLCRILAAVAALAVLAVIAVWKINCCCCDEANCETTTVETAAVTEQASETPTETTNAQ